MQVALPLLQLQAASNLGQRPALQLELWLAEGPVTHPRTPDGSAEPEFLGVATLPYTPDPSDPTIALGATRATPENIPAPARVLARGAFPLHDVLRGTHHGCVYAAVALGVSPGNDALCVPIPALTSAGGREVRSDSGGQMAAAARHEVRFHSEAGAHPSSTPSMHASPPAAEASGEAVACGAGEERPPGSGVRAAQGEPLVEVVHTFNVTIDRVIGLPDAEDLRHAQLPTPESRYIRCALRPATCEASSGHHLSGSRPWTRGAAWQRGLGSVGSTALSRTLLYKPALVHMWCKNWLR